MCKEQVGWAGADGAGRRVGSGPPSFRMSAGTRSSAMTAQAPASSAMRACSTLTTSMMTPPLSIWAMPAFTAKVPVEAAIVDESSRRTPLAQPRFVFVCVGLRKESNPATPTTTGRTHRSATLQGAWGLAPHVTDSRGASHFPPLETARSIVPAAAGRKRTCKGHTISAREQPRRMRGEAAAQLRAYPDRSSRKKKKSLAALERGGRAGWRRGRGKGSLRSPAEDCVRLLRLCPRVCPKAVRLVVLKAGDLNLLTRQELLSSQSCATGCPPGLQSRPCLA